jgi:hypothetical protein
MLSYVYEEQIRFTVRITCKQEGNDRKMQEGQQQRIAIVLMRERKREREKAHAYLPTHY